MPILAACAIGILMFVYHRRSITVDGIIAAVAAYRLIAFVFAEIYLLMQMSTPDRFRFPTPIAVENGPGLASSMLNLSFVTIATLGD